MNDVVEDNTPSSATMHVDNSQVVGARVLASHHFTISPFLAVSRLFSGRDLKA